MRHPDPRGQGPDGADSVWEDRRQEAWCDAFRARVRGEHSLSPDLGGRAQGKGEPEDTDVPPGSLHLHLQHQETGALKRNFLNCYFKKFKKNITICRKIITFHIFLFSLYSFAIVYTPRAPPSLAPGAPEA